MSLRETAGTRRRPLAIGAVVVAGILFTLVGLFVWQTVVYYREIRSVGLQGIEDRRLQASISSVVANTEVTEEDLALLIPTGVFPERGPRTAPVTIVEFVDYQCPFCQRVAPTVRKVTEAYGDRVRLVIRDFPVTSLHPTAVQSAVAARCTLLQGQDVYWRFHDLLYSDIQTHTPEQLRAWAQAAGARVDTFTACLADERVAAQVDRDLQVGLRVGVQGTPTFFVNGVRFQGALDERLLSRIIDVTLERVEQEL